MIIPGVAFHIEYLENHLKYIVLRSSGDHRKHITMSLPQTFIMEAAQGPILVPVIGFGTWDAGEPSWCEEAVLAALNAGYRHLDCAWKYGVSPVSDP